MNHLENMTTAEYEECVIKQKTEIKEEVKQIDKEQSEIEKRIENLEKQMKEFMKLVGKK